MSPVAQDGEDPQDLDGRHVEVGLEWPRPGREAAVVEESVVPDPVALLSVKAQVSDYLPVSILTALSKVLERVVMRQLNKYVDSKMPNCQFGFRPRRSTTAAIVAAHGAWSSARSGGDVVGIAAYDLSAAFDTLDHARVLDKLRMMGVGQRETT